MEGSDSTDVCPEYISRTEVDRTGTGQSTVLFQELSICWIMNIIPGFILAADLGRMICQCTVAGIYCIWLHFNEQRTSCCPPTPTGFSSSPALMIPWVWSSSVEVIFSVGCLSDPVSYKLLYWRCRNRNPYLLLVLVVFFFPFLNLRTIICSNSPNNSQCNLTYRVFFRSFICTISWHQLIWKVCYCLVHW